MLPAGPWQRGWDGAELPEDGTNLVPFAAVLSPGGAAERCRGGVKADSEKCVACNLGSVIEPCYLISWPWLLSVGGSGSGFCITNRISAHVRAGVEVEERLKGFFLLLFYAWDICPVQFQMQFAAHLLASGKEVQWEAP